MCACSLLLPPRTSAGFPQLFPPSVPGKDPVSDFLVVLLFQHLIRVQIANWGTAPGCSISCISLATPNSGLASLHQRHPRTIIILFASSLHPLCILSYHSATPQAHNSLLPSSATVHGYHTIFRVSSVSILHSPKRLPCLPYPSLTTF